MSWIATAVIGGAVIGGVIQGNAAKSAADTQANAANNASLLAQNQFNTAQAETQPYRDVGQQALFKLSDYLGLPATPGAPATTPSDTTGSLTKPFSFNISKDPGYQFRMDQGTTAVENSAAARGSQLSGATLKELLKYGQDYASGEFNAAFQRDQATKNQVYSMLTGAAGIGIGATNTSVNAGTQNAATLGSNITGAANANAAGQIGVANAMSGAIGSVPQAFLLKNILGNNNPGVNAVNQGVTLPSTTSSLDASSFGA